jgi:hypothetical protein
VHTSVPNTREVEIGVSWVDSGLDYTGRQGPGGSHGMLLIAQHQDLCSTRELAKQSVPLGWDCWRES